MIEQVFIRKPLYLAISMSLMAAFSVGSVDAQDTLNAKLDRAEMALVGKTSPDQPVDSRLGAIESGLFGKVKHGNVTKRMDSVLDFLGGSASTGGARAGGTNVPAGAVNPLATGGSSSPGAGTSPGDRSSSVGAALPSGGFPWPTDNSSAAAASPPASSGSTSSSSGNPSSDSSAASAAGSSSTDLNLNTSTFSNTNKSNAAIPSKAAASGTDKKTTPVKTGWPYTQKSAQTALAAPLKAQEAKMAPPPSASAVSKSGGMPPPPTTSANANAPINNVAKGRELLREGLRQYAAGSYRDAELTFRKVLTVDPRSSDAFYNLGSIAERNHDYVMALTNYRAALNLSPKDKDYLAATTAMEKQLSTQSHPSPSVSSPHSSAVRAKETLKTAQSNSDSSLPATANADGTDGAPQIPSAAGEPFQLSGTRNDLLSNSTQFSNNFGPMMNASQGGFPTVGVNQQNGNWPMMGVNQNGGQPPVFGVNQQPPKKNGTLGNVLKYGARAALMGSGLHCPICRMTGGTMHF